MPNSTPSLAAYDRYLREKAQHRPLDFATRRLWDSFRCWRRLSFHWRLDGGEVDHAEAWRVWAAQYDGDEAAALGALLLMLDSAGALDVDPQGAA